MLTICGAIFEAAKPDQELTRLEARTAAPDFWKDQADAQKVLQRRRRLEQDRELIESLKKKGKTIKETTPDEAIDLLRDALDR